MHPEEIMRAVTAWARNAHLSNRYREGGDVSFLYAITSRLLSAYSSCDQTGTEKLDTQKLASRLRTVVQNANIPLTLSVRKSTTIASEVQAYHSSFSTLPAGGRAAAACRDLLCGLVADWSSIPVGRRRLARRAAAVVGLAYAREVGKFESIPLSARFVAVRVGCSPATGARLLNDLVAVRFLRPTKLMRDGRTRTFKVRAVGSSQLAKLAALALADDAAALAGWLAGGERPAAGSVADVVAAAGSPAWLAAGVPDGAFVAALADAGAGLARRRLADVMSAGAAAEDLRMPMREFRQLFRKKEMGLPDRPAAARAWLEGRPAGVSFLDWLDSQPGADEARAAFEAAEADRLREARQRRKAADAAAGRKRKYVAPEEWAGLLLARCGGRPTTPAELPAWLAEVQALWAKQGSKHTTARRSAVVRAVRRVAELAGASEAAAGKAAERVVAEG